jgi:DNA polymerase-3 subunit epsilon
VDELDRVGTEHVYGFFRSRSSARQALRGLAKAHGLCPALMGLERREAGAACTAYALQECRGACVGGESRIRHTMRAVQALNGLRMKRWPYAGPVGIRERSSENDRCELHLVDRWCYLGSAKSEADLHELAETSQKGAFHPDTYKMLLRFLKTPGASCDILPLTKLRPTEELT